MKIVKTTDDGKQTPLPGVKFKLIREDQSPVFDGSSEKELITDETGVANISHLPIGRYKVQEIDAPDWIDFNPMTAQVHSFEVKSSDLTGTELSIINSIKKTAVSVEKQWVGEKGESAKIWLVADGVRTQFVELNAEKGWNHTFTDLKKYSADGKLIVYAVEEAPVPDGYISEIFGSAASGFVVRNTKKVTPPPVIPEETTSVSVTKQWVGSVEESAKIWLVADGVRTQFVELNAQNGWNHTFTNLKKYSSNGRRIAYTVEEEIVNGYTVTIMGNADNGFIVVNAKVTEQDTNTGTGTDIPYTGDDTPVFLYACVFAVSGLGLLLVLRSMKKNKRPHFKA